MALSGTDAILVKTVGGVIVKTNTIDDVKNYVNTAQVLPVTVDLTPYAFKVISGNAQTQQNYTACYHGWWVFQDTPALNDEIEAKVLLAAGSYTMTLWYGRFTSFGKVTWYLNGNSIGTVDAYNVSLQYGFVSTLSLTVSSGGLQTLRAKVTGKNASGTTPFYYHTLQNVTIRPS